MELGAARARAEGAGGGGAAAAVFGGVTGRATGARSGVGCMTLCDDATGATGLAEVVVSLY